MLESWALEAEGLPVENNCLLCPWNSPGKNTGAGCRFLSPGDLPNPGIEPGAPALPAGSLPLSHQGSPVIPQRALLAQLSEAVAFLCIGGLHFAGVPCMF